MTARLLVVVLSALLAVPGFGATRYTAVNGGCAHMAVACSAHATCGTAAPAGAPGSEVFPSGNTAPCCSLEDADAKAANGDTIEMHEGVYAGVSVPWQSINASAALSRSGTTIRYAAGEEPSYLCTALSTPRGCCTGLHTGTCGPIIDGGDTVSACIGIPSGVNNVTIDGIACQNHRCGTASGDGTFRTGIVHIQGTNTGARLKNFTLHADAITPAGCTGPGVPWASCTNAGACSGSGANGCGEEYACGGVRLSDNVDNAIVENGKIDGYSGHGLFVERPSAVSGQVFRNLYITETGPGGSSANRGIIIKSPTSASNGPLVFYNLRINLIANGMTTPGIFIREPRAGAKIYVFNAIITGVNQYGLNMQDNSGPFDLQDVTTFNSTIVGGSALAKWNTYFSASRLVNMLASSVTTGAVAEEVTDANYKHGKFCEGGANDCQACTANSQCLAAGAPGAGACTNSPLNCGTNTQCDDPGMCQLGDVAWSTTRDKLAYSVLEFNSSIYSGSGAASPGTGCSGGPCVDFTGTVRSASALSSRDANNNLTAPLGVATNDPIGMGHGTCFIFSASLNIDCSEDINGTDRLLAWDAGADNAPDAIAPATVTISTTRRTPTSVRLTWTAPGNNGNVGTASSYDIRYAAVPDCSGFNFGAATAMTGATNPLPAGSTENMFVPGLTANTSYCFGIRTSDGVNESGDSNFVAQATAPINNDLPILKGLRKGAGSHYTVEGFAHGTSTETTLKTTRPLSFDAAQLLLEGDVDGATITISLRESRFQPGEADLFTASGVVSGGRFVVNASAVGNITKINRLSLPPGNYILRVASSSADSRGAVSGEISILKR